MGQVYNGEMNGEQLLNLAVQKIAQEQNEELLQNLRRLVEDQDQTGTSESEEYMRGLYNGTEYMIAMIEGREPVYKESPLTEERWTAAVNNANFMLKEYQNIPTGTFGAITIAQTISRYENGERTKELLDDLEAIE
ncbi:hypothetical protein [Paenibacillus sp. L3-i20]|uniref:hypothetical protein n=1 Tax=Paenibacillus sp. L3-i20 TaxID=2905833 RepID=UPI001EDF19C8|nr:hypothetical protein [Paenibacillus sp. L3-i20]GKU76859.1 hypothetical protein L3i20_v212560 [Paenibacillus sp. L3-i20]